MTGLFYVVARQTVKFPQGPFDHISRDLHDGGFVAVRPAKRLGDDDVDNAELYQILRRYLHIGCRVLRTAGIAPQDRGCSFRRGDRIDRVLKHEDAVRGGQRHGLR